MELGRNMAPSVDGCEGDGFAAKLLPARDQLPVLHLCHKHIRHLLAQSRSPHSRLCIEKCVCLQSSRLYHPLHLKDGYPFRSGLFVALY